jgi:hypothetical protein
MAEKMSTVENLLKQEKKKGGQMIGGTEKKFRNL